MIFASKGWKKQQQDCINRDLKSFHHDKLSKLTQQDISGYSFEEMIIHYGFISHAATQYAISNYIQTSSLADSEYYLSLATKAKQISNTLVDYNPRRASKQATPIQIENIAIAVLCNLKPDAIGMVEASEASLRFEQNKKNQRKIAIEANLYKNLLQDNPHEIYQCIQELDSINYDSIALSVFHAYMEKEPTLFADALINHMREFRSNPYPEDINYFVLLMESLFLKHTSFELLNLADAPAEMLSLPEWNPLLFNTQIGLSLPTLDLAEILKRVDKNKVGPAFKQY